MIYNAFSQVLQEALRQVFTARLKCYVHIGEDANIEYLPLVIINDQGGPEGVFQSGIYEHTVEFTVRSTVVGGTGDDAPAAHQMLFSQVMDLLQQTNLRELLMATTPGLWLTQPTGVVLGDVGALEISGDSKVWQRTAECLFIGAASS